VPPQLATLVSDAPPGEDWIHEIKYDGYRFLCRVESGRTRLLTRSGLDWTERFESVAAAAGKLSARRAMLDGEMVVMRADGVSSFQDLQNALRGGRDQELVFFAFDLIHLDGFDLTHVPLIERKRILNQVLASSGVPGGVLRYSDHVIGQGKEFHGEACRRGLEGIVSKRANGFYTSGRTGEWLKSKCTARQEFVIGGYTEPQGSRSGLGALLLGVRDARKGLKYSGKVGTGFTADSLRDLSRRLHPLERTSPPFSDPPRLRGAHWVEPKLVAEVAFTHWTDDGRLRHPSFQGLREDKPARDVVAEAPKERPPAKRRTPPKPPRKRPPVDDPTSKPPLQEPPPTSRSPIQEPPEDEGKPSVAGVALSHPRKVLFAEQGLTKLDLARYMEQVSRLMVPQVKGRPLMLLRCPEGSGKSCFFQKHPSGEVHRSLAPVRVRESNGSLETYLTLRDTAGLVSLVQMGALELHVWGSRADAIEKPDRVVFDLDPDPSVPWAFVIETARRVRERLRSLGLTSFPKTTGGKGIHVVVPIRRGPGWPEVKAFSAGLASELVREEPDRLTTHLAKARRAGRIFIDTLRNRRGATWVAPYSPRARPGAPVSTPVSWEELTPKLEPDRFTVRSVPERLDRKKDPWAGMDSTRQTVTASMLRSLESRR
jgi:bifunctional non-homologous end joining protein LigD